MARKPNFGRTYISFDWAMKRLLRNKANFVILEGFLTELLRQDIQVNSLLESEGNVDLEDDKVNRLDLLCQTQNKELIIIEVQFHNEIDYFQRMLFGASKLLTEYLKAGEPYNKVRKVYSVNILYFDLGQGSDYVYHGYMHFQGKHMGDELLLSRRQQLMFDGIRPGDVYPEYFILKINNFDEVAKDSLDEWIYYLKTNDLPQGFQAKGLAEVEKQLKVDQMSPELKAKYKKHLKGLLITESMIETAYGEGEERGMEKGIEKGIEISKANIILNAHQSDAPIAFIAQIVGLSEAEVLEVLKANGQF
ncbi:MAG: Rpn family recombination-promoting nuclease/putative transposase [Sphingobacteriaceae bacterium]|nr:Rpn family recombination-promoting nuclease/putative transposase [Sphingobacteriaceae bacterium]